MTKRNYNKVETHFKKGVIVSVDYDKDTCDVLVDDVVYSDVKVHYHCDEKMEDEGGSSPFAPDDEVVCLFEFNNIKEVIGFVGERKPCDNEVWFTNILNNSSPYKHLTVTRIFKDKITTFGNINYSNDIIDYGVNQIEDLSERETYLNDIASLLMSPPELDRAGIIYEENLNVAIKDININTNYDFSPEWDYQDTAMTLAYFDRVWHNVLYTVEPIPNPTSYSNSVVIGGYFKITMYVLNYDEENDVITPVAKKLWYYVEKYYSVGLRFYFFMGTFFTFPQMFVGDEIGPVGYFDKIVDANQSATYCIDSHYNYVGITNSPKNKKSFEETYYYKETYKDERDISDPEYGLYEISKYKRFYNLKGRVDRYLADEVVDPILQFGTYNYDLRTEWGCRYNAKYRTDGCLYNGVWLMTDLPYNTTCFKYKNVSFKCIAENDTLLQHVNGTAQDILSLYDGSFYETKYLDVDSTTDGGYNSVYAGINVKSGEIDSEGKVIYTPTINNIDKHLSAYIDSSSFVEGVDCTPGNLGYININDEKIPLENLVYFLYGSYALTPESTTFAYLISDVVIYKVEYIVFVAFNKWRFYKDAQGFIYLYNDKRYSYVFLAEDKSKLNIDDYIDLYNYKDTGAFLKRMDFFSNIQTYIHNVSYDFRGYSSFNITTSESSIVWYDTFVNILQRPVNPITFSYGKLGERYKE